jgi:hypothetical protein
MSSAAWPSVIGAVMTVATAALAPVRVVRGLDVSGDPSDAVMIGLQDIQVPDWASAGSFQQTMQTFGGNREEVGTVHGLLLARDGGGDQALAGTTAFGYLASLEAAVRADPTLGLTGFDYVVAEMSAGDVTESQNDEGAATVLSFVISYKVRI